jgi:hypothetical protein
VLKVHILCDTNDDDDVDDDDDDVCVCVCVCVCVVLGCVISPEVRTYWIFEGDRDQQLTYVTRSVKKREGKGGGCAGGEPVGTGSLERVAVYPSPVGGGGGDTGSPARVVPIDSCVPHTLAGDAPFVITPKVKLVVNALVVANALPDTEGLRESAVLDAVTALCEDADGKTEMSAVFGAAGALRPQVLAMQLATKELAEKARQIQHTRLTGEESMLKLKVEADKLEQEARQAEFRNRIQKAKQEELRLKKDDAE